MNEILGTRYLRAQDYVNAVGALSKVSPSYQYRMNLVPYMNRLPFVFLPTRSAVAPDYKLSFARQMLQYRNESMSSRLSPAVNGFGFGREIDAEFDYLLAAGKEWLVVTLFLDLFQGYFGGFIPL